MRTVSHVQDEAFFPRALRKSIAAHNERLNELNAQAASIPVRKTELARRVMAGEISGADALAEKKALTDLAIAIEIDRRMAMVQRDELNPAIRAAYAAEAAKCKAAADKRFTEIQERFKTCGLALDNAAKDAAVRGDAEFQAAHLASKNYSEKAARGCMHPDAVGEWLGDFGRLAHQVFGAPEASSGAFK